MADFLVQPGVLRLQKHSNPGWGRERIPLNMVHTKKEVGELPEALDLFVCLVPSTIDLAEM